MDTVASPAFLWALIAGWVLTCAACALCAALSTRSLRSAHAQSAHNPLQCATCARPELRSLRRLLRSELAQERAHAQSAHSSAQPAQSARSQSAHAQGSERVRKTLIVRNSAHAHAPAQTRAHGAHVRNELAQENS